MVPLHKYCTRKCNFNVCLFQKQIREKKSLYKMTLVHYNQHKVKSKIYKINSGIINNEIKRYQTEIKAFYEVKGRKISQCLKIFISYP